MVKLIQKCGYVKAAKAVGYMKYIATREGVERIKRNGPVSDKQQEMIKTILKDYPDAKRLFEYEDYCASPSFQTASALIAMALDCHVQEDKMRSGYLKYMATRPRAERIGEHGLFSSEQAVNLESAMNDLNKHSGNAWTMIYSLRREDAIRLGYDHVESWRNLILRNSAVFAESLKSTPAELHWYAAFHDEGCHPHIHMMLWSDNPQAYLSKEHLLKLRSVMTNDIFKDELLNIYQRKELSYKELITASRERMKELVEKIQSAPGSDVLDRKLTELSAALENVSGKHQYGYLPKPIKRMVDELVDKLSELPEVRDAYAAWNGIRDELEQYYKDKPREHHLLRDQKEFKAIKNIVICEADSLHTYHKQKYVEENPTQQFVQQTEIATVEKGWSNNSSLVHASVDLLYHLSRIFQNNTIPPGNPLGVRIDSKRRKKLREKRMALGHKPDDHEKQISY